VDSSIEPLRPEVSLAAITHHLATYNMVAAPVVDENDHLLGAVTVDDVLDHLLPDDWRHGGQPFDRTAAAAEVPDGA
jgi:Mg/Co/Ni transporter MgtE